MKKQLLIGAVASTMSVAALADISITGAASATWTHTDFDAAATANTNEYAQDTDITITGTTGDTTVSTSIDLNASGTTEANVGDITMSTTLMGMDVTVVDDGGVIDFKLVTDIAGVTLTFEDNNSNANGSVQGAMDIAGATVTVKQAETATTTTVTGDMGGITGTYKNVSNDGANKDTSSISITGSALGSTLTVSSYSGESSAAAWVDLDGDTAENNDSTDGTVIKLTTDLGGNSVTITSTNSDVNGAQSDGGTGEDKTVIAGSRALDSGATLTATYTDDDLGDKSSVALKIAVSF